MPPDVILTGGIIHTMNPGQPRATALALAGDTILAVGDDDAIAALAAAGVT